MPAYLRGIRLRNGFLASSRRLSDLNMTAKNIPSSCNITNIVVNDAMILPYDVAPNRT
jgi:hypothetical protein